MTSMLFPFNDREGRRGYIDEEGQVVIPLTFGMGGIEGTFSEGRAPVYDDDNNRYGYIDLTGRLVVPFKYDSCRPFSEGRAWVRRGGAWGLIDPDGREIGAFDFWAEQAEGFTETNSRLSHVTFPGAGGKHGHVNREGTVVTAFVYDDAREFREERAAVRAQGGYGYVATDGRLVIEPQYERAGQFSEGLASVQPSISRDDPFSAHLRVPGKSAAAGPRPRYIDRSGNVAFEHDFPHARRFVTGRAAVEAKKKWGYIDPTGKIAIAPAYKDVDAFLPSGVAFVLEARRAWRLIDRDGGVVGQGAFTDRYERASFGGELLCVQRDKKWGFVNCRGEYVIGPRFTDSAYFAHGLAYVGEEIGKRLRIGYINRAGEYVFALDF